MKLNIENHDAALQAAELLSAQERQVRESFRRVLPLCKGQRVSSCRALQVHFALLAEIEVARLVLNGELEYATVAMSTFDVDVVATPDMAEQLYSAAHAIAVERGQKLAEQRAALQSNDVATALRLARELCGLEEESVYEAGNRTHSRVN